MRAASKQIHASSHPKLNWTSINWKQVKKKVRELQMRIAKAVLNRTTGSPWPGRAFEGLELCDGKPSRTVLRGLGGSNAPRLPGPDARV
jgi:hypothetical protein